eukprot:1977526-Amphidinium_carterae.2
MGSKPEFTPLCVRASRQPSCPQSLTQNLGPEPDVLRHGCKSCIVEAVGTKLTRRSNTLRLTNVIDFGIPLKFPSLKG